jgi:hypothetical protein
MVVLMNVAASPTRLHGITTQKRLEFGWHAYMVLLELSAAYGFIVIFFSLFKRMPG